MAHMGFCFAMVEFCYVMEGFCYVGPFSSRRVAKAYIEMSQQVTDYDCNDDDSAQGFVIHLDFGSCFF